MSTAAPSTPHGRRKASTARRTLWWVVCLAPLVCAFVLQWLPIFNGPHLFLGIPTIMWWTCVPGSLMVSLVLAIVEFTRTDADHEERLDREAIALGEERKNQGNAS
ncbi:hypothetical protein GMA10_12365 [Kocuria koreensis]|jgi:hypothetical protein|uniref:DUF3311 domain-containing protein n=1 Tax=Rothia koreensis TaxID=592378 RepID=A0A7M3SW27_9MICC|nr:hypothetical protein [Rothia koreensis]MUN55992.1 hypothetical protein [Rothia koreensis]